MSISNIDKIREKVEKLKQLADAMYNKMQNLTTDASGIKKAMDDYHQFIIFQYHEEELASKDLEEAAKENARYERGDSVETLYDLNRAAGFIDGAQWQKEQIMKDAIDAKIGSFVNGTIYDADFNIDSNLKDDEKIKIIIIKSK